MHEMFLKVYLPVASDGVLTYGKSKFALKYSRDEQSLIFQTPTLLLLHVSKLLLLLRLRNILKCHLRLPLTRDVEAAISSTASTSTPIASASNRRWNLTEPGLYLIYELADNHDYQNQHLTIYKCTLLFKMVA